MRVTQGTFSFLPDLTDAQIAAQVEHALARGWAISVEHSSDPHPRDVFWEMWGPPMFDLRDAAAALREVRACRAAFPGDYVKLNAFDATGGWETVRLSFLVGRPPAEARFELSRREGAGGAVRYALRRAGEE